MRISCLIRVHLCASVVPFFCLVGLIPQPRLRQHPRPTESGRGEFPHGSCRMTAAGGPDPDLDILAQRVEEAHEPPLRDSRQLVVNEPGNLSLIGFEPFRGVDLAQPLATDFLVHQDREPHFLFILVGIRKAKIGKYDVAAVVDHGKTILNVVNHCPALSLVVILVVRLRALQCLLDRFDVPLVGLRPAVGRLLLLKGVQSRAVQPGTPTFPRHGNEYGEAG